MCRTISYVCDQSSSIPVGHSACTEHNTWYHFHLPETCTPASEQYLLLYIQYFGHSGGNIFVKMNFSQKFILHSGIIMKIKIAFKWIISSNEYIYISRRC